MNWLRAGYESELRIISHDSDRKIRTINRMITVVGRKSQQHPDGSAYADPYGREIKSKNSIRAETR